MASALLLDLKHTLWRPPAENVITPDPEPYVAPDPELPGFAALAGSDHVWRHKANTAARQKEYLHLYGECAPNKKKSTLAWGQRLCQKGRARYEPIANVLKMPWEIVAVTHMKEASFDFGAHLFNGDPLTARTKQHPAGQPVPAPLNGRAYTWEESALAAIKWEAEHKKIPLNHYRWDLPNALFWLEGYNGFGYREKHGVWSPYLWAMSNLHTQGMYIRDHVYSATAVPKNPGSAVMLKLLGFQGR